MSGEHLFHARGCAMPTPVENLMCARHWYAVPAPLRRRVWRAYRPGQCDDKAPSAEWIAAANAAIEHVSNRERAVRPDLFTQTEP